MTRVFTHSIFFSISKKKMKWHWNYCMSFLLFALSKWYQKINHVLCKNFGILSSIPMVYVVSNSFLFSLNFFWEAINIPSHFTQFIQFHFFFFLIWLFSVTNRSAIWTHIFRHFVSHIVQLLIYFHGAAITKVLKIKQKLPSSALFVNSMFIKQFIFKIKTRMNVMPI